MDVPNLFAENIKDSMQPMISIITEIIKKYLQKLELAAFFSSEMEKGSAFHFT